MSILANAKLVDKGGNSVEVASLEGKTIGLYFSAHWCPPCKRYTPMLSDKYKELVEAGKALEIIFVSSDSNEEEGKHYYESMADWLMLDFNDDETKEKLDEEFEVEGIPTLVLLDGTEGHKLITKEGRGAIMECPFDELMDYAEKKRLEEERKAAELAALKASFSLDKVFNDGSIIDNDGNTVPLSDFSDKTVGLYFSAHWCPPCRGFTPKLAEKYKEICGAGKSFEIIFISSDRNEESAMEYFADMPWKMCKYDNRDAKQKLAELYEINGIPSLIILDPSGKTITDDGRECVMSCNFDDWPKFEEEKRRKLEEANAKARAMPEKIKDKRHEHTLEKKESVYGGQYGCDICGMGGEGFVYHCDECGFDIHPSCVDAEEQTIFDSSVPA